MRLLYQKGLLCGNEMLRCNQRQREKRDRVRGAIRTEETADNSLIDGNTLLTQEDRLP